MMWRPLIPFVVLLVVTAVLLLVCVRAAVHGRGTRGSALTWIRRTALVLVVAVVGLGPSVPHEDVETVRSNVEVYLVVDRTGSMSATDHGDGRQRLAGVRDDITAIANALPGARFSIIGFDSTATQQLPLTTDTRAVRSWVGSLHQELTSYSTGSLIDRPLAAVQDALERAGRSYPDDERYVFLLSDGENTAEGSPQSFAPLAGLIDGGAVLGYGTPEGATMTVYDPAAPDDGEEILDYSQPGAPPAVSRIDEVQLRAVADQLGVPYVHRTGTPADATAESLVAGIDLSQVAAVGFRTVTVHRYVVWPGAIAIALLLVWELAAAVRRTSRPVLGGGPSGADRGGRDADLVVPPPGYRGGAP